MKDSFNPDAGQLIVWISRGVRVSKSTHPGLWLLSYRDGGFVTVHGSYEEMLRRHPLDKRQEFHYNEVFHFHPSRIYEGGKMEKMQSPNVRHN